MVSEDVAVGIFSVLALLIICAPGIIRAWRSGR